MTKIIALAGKGGVGKTSLSALLVKILSKDPSKRILAIDGDPAVGLSTALGITVKRTLDDIRKAAVQQLEGETPVTTDMILRELDYELTDALEEKRGFAFLAIGRPEGKGCYCAINEYLKMLIGEIAPNFDYVVIDGEAGIEQINRRVMEKVTHLLLVSDASRKGLNVAKSIFEVASGSVMYEKAGLIVNRIQAEEEISNLALPEGVPFLGVLPENQMIRKADMRGEPLCAWGEDPLVLEYERLIHTFLDIEDEACKE